MGVYFLSVRKLVA